MKKINYETLLSGIKGTTVERPNKSSAGTLSGHAAGEPFEKKVYQYLKKEYESSIFKQYEFLNDLYLKNPQFIKKEDRYALLESPTALFLLSRGDKATQEWSPNNIFEEKQNDTADILFYKNGFYDLIDVKTRNKNKNAQPPNIISAYKLAKACAIMIDNSDFNIGINYIEIDWTEKNETLICEEAYYANLFKADPKSLYINWAAAMQIQFHVCDLDQSWESDDMNLWAKEYLRVFVKSAETRCEKMKAQYITPFLKYIKDIK